MKKNFFVLMYDRTCPYKFMKECRKYLFTKMNHTVETSPYKKKKKIHYSIFTKQCYNAIFLLAV